MKAENTTKPKYNLWQNSGFMISLAWKNQKSVLWLCLIVSILEVITNLLGLYITPTILNAVETKVPINVLIKIILFFVIALIIVRSASAYFLRNTIFGQIQLRINIGSMIVEKIMTISYPNTENQDVKKKFEKASMCVRSNDDATEAIWNTLSEILKNVACFIIYIFLLISMDPFIIIIILSTTIIGFFINKSINAWGYRHRDEEAEYSSRMTYISEKSEDYTIAKDIRIFSMQTLLEDVYNNIFKLYQAFIARGEKVYIWTDFINLILAFFRNGIAYLYLINMVLHSQLSASQFLLYFTAIGGFTAWMNGILANFHTLHKQCLDISAVREYIEYPELFLFENGEPIQPDLSKSYELELRNVSFKYPGAEKHTLKNINLIIKPGEKLAVVGLNGAGKTTLIKLICGFYDPTDGQVLLNGINIKKYNRQDYYKLFSAVFQNFSLLAISIASNIAQTHNNIDMEKVKVCAEKAGISKKISTLPNEYDTNIGKEIFEDGIELSGGEIQNLMLARALYKDAPIIILDEPTAALDPIAESDIYNKYNDLTSGRTSIYISHRLASTGFCHRIILIDDNIIAEEGTHDTLINKNGKYAELFEIQSRYYREGGIEDGKNA